MMTTYMMTITARYLNVVINWTLSEMPNFTLRRDGSAISLLEGWQRDKFFVARSATP
jgi:hypothetical protein